MHFLLQVSVLRKNFYDNFRKIWVIFDNVYVRFYKILCEIFQRFDFIFKG